MSESAGRLPASLVALAVGIGTAAEGTAMNLPPQWVFVGTYTGPESRGIYRLAFDPTTGKLSEPTLAAETPNPLVPRDRARRPAPLRRQRSRAV